MHDATLSNGGVPLGDRIAEHFEQHTKVTLMLEALKDAQGTIRAIDTKVGILLAALAIPLPYVVGIVTSAREHGFHASFGVLCGSVALVSYVVAGFIAIRALTGTADATSHVKRAEQTPDVFYLGGLYKLGWLDAGFNRRSTVSKRNLEEISATIPRHANTVLDVLVNELMILAYIRDVKLFRQKAAFELTALAFVLGVLSLIP